MPRDLHPLARNLGERPPWLDQVEAREMLEELGVGRIYEASMDELLFSCPFEGHSHGDERPSAYMNTGAKQASKNTVWKCHGCGRSGNAISFVAEYQGISRQRATRELRERFAPGWHKPRGGSMRAEFELRKKTAKELEEEKYPEIVILPWDTYKRFEVDWPSFEDVDKPDAQYMYGRGFTTSDLTEWRIGYDHASDRITIPVCTPDGQLVGIKGRAWNKQARLKYRILGDTERTIRRDGIVYYFAPYLKSQVVFGIDKWGEQRTYVWDEGEINVMSWWKMGIPAFATGSAHMSDAQVRTIREYADEVVMFLDPDKAGETGIWGYTDKDDEYHPGAVEKLAPFVRVRIAAPHAQDANDLLVARRVNHARKLIRDAKPHWRLQAPVVAL
jgi:CHC2 zinc finger/Toprim-like